MSPLNHLFCAQDSLLSEKEIHHWQSSLHFPKLPSPQMGKLWHRGWTKCSLFLNHFMPLQEACYLQRSYSSAQSRSLPWSQWAEQRVHILINFACHGNESLANTLGASLLTPLLPVIIFIHCQRTPRKEEWSVKINLPPETLLEVMLNSRAFGSLFFWDQLSPCYNGFSLHQLGFWPQLFSARPDVFWLTDVIV